MNKIQQMIQQLCPEGVEFRKLTTVANILYGYPFDASKFSNDASLIPLIRIRDVIPAKAGTYYDGEYDKAYIVKKGDMLVGMDGNFNLAKWNDRDGLLNQRVCKVSTSDSNVCLDGYLFHILGPIFKHIENTIQGSTVKHLSAAKIKTIEIPVPPLPIQSEIVSILDKFTQLEAELEAELDCRKRQYEHYRDKLLAFKGREDVEWKKLGEVGIFVRGKRFVRTDIVEEGVPCIHYGDMYTFYGLQATEAHTHLTKEKASKMRFAKKNDVVIVGAGENDMDIGVGLAWMGDEDVAVHDACYIFKSNLNPRYVAHYLRTSAYHWALKKYVSSGKICSVSAKGIGEMIIPIPSPIEQQRIADILDRFEALTTSISEGLPAEIAARRQQYEYYRNQLLSFNRKQA